MGSFFGKNRDKFRQAIQGGRTQQQANQKQANQQQPQQQASKPLSSQPTQQPQQQANQQQQFRNQAGQAQQQSNQMTSKQQFMNQANQQPQSPFRDVKVSRGFGQVPNRQQLSLQNIPEHIRNPIAPPTGKEIRYDSNSDLNRLRTLGPESLRGHYQNRPSVTSYEDAVRMGLVQPPVRTGGPVQRPMPNPIDSIFGRPPRRFGGIFDRIGGPVQPPRREPSPFDKLIGRPVQPPVRTGGPVRRPNPIDAIRSGIFGEPVKRPPKRFGGLLGGAFGQPRREPTNLQDLVRDKGLALAGLGGSRRESIKDLASLILRRRGGLF